MMRDSERRHCTINRKRPGHGDGHFRAAFRHISLSVSTCAAHVLGRVAGSCWGESPTNLSCTSTAPSRLAEIGALELHDIGGWRSVHRHCLLSTTGRGWYCFHDGKSFLKVRQPLLCSLVTHGFLIVCFHPAHTHTTPLVFPY